MVGQGFRGNPEIRTNESRSQLGDQFFKSVRLRTKAPGEVAREAGAVSGPVGQLMKGYRVEALGLGEAVTIGHEDLIEHRTIKCLRAAFFPRRTAVAENGIGRLDAVKRLALALGRRQSVALVRVENGIAAKHRDFARRDFAGRVVGFLPFQGLEINNVRCLLALAHRPAQLGRLLVGKPSRGAVSLRVGREPKHQDIDAGIRALAGHVVG